ncbi:hypothetical protein ACFE04_003453 [Oxalis oulophora]
MSSSMGLKLACVVLMLMVVGAPLAQATITCGTVTSKIAPCFGYLKGGPLGSGCCPGVKALNAAASSTPDRKAACNCMKSAAGSISGLNYALAAGLPAKCGVSIPYKISPSTDCSTVK